MVEIGRVLDQRVKMAVILWCCVFVHAYVCEGGRREGEGGKGRERGEEGGEEEEERERGGICTCVSLRVKRKHGDLCIFMQVNCNTRAEKNILTCDKWVMNDGQGTFSGL